LYVSLFEKEIKEKLLIFENDIYLTKINKSHRNNFTLIETRITSKEKILGNQEFF